jgi:hypothetical protein
MKVIFVISEVDYPYANRNISEIDCHIASYCWINREYLGGTDIAHSPGQLQRVKRSKSKSHYYTNRRLWPAEKAAC